MDSFFAFSDGLQNPTLCNLVNRFTSPSAAINNGFPIDKYVANFWGIVSEKISLFFKISIKPLHFVKIL